MAKHFLINENKYKNVLIDAYRLIYFELPKNACTSMKTQLAEVLQLPKRADFPRYIHRDKAYQFPPAKRRKILTEYKDYLRFAIIRNPWERLVSCYKDKIFYKDEDNTYFIKTNPQFKREMPFDEFVDLVVSIPDHLADFHFCSQMSLLTDFDGNFLCNYLGELDNLNFHLEKIKSLTRIPFETKTHLNKTKNSSYEEYYTPELIEKVRQRYRWDIDFFGFEFGKKNETFQFGFLTEEQKKRFENPEFVVSILKEKSRELQGILAKTDRDLKHYKQDKKEIQNSLSWKITQPLRNVANVVGTKKKSLTYDKYSKILAANKLKRLTSKKIENKHLFILSPNYCGSTLLNELISTSPNVSVNNPFSTREGQGIPSVKKMMYDHNRRWDTTLDFDWEFIKSEWNKYWDTTKPVLLEKSPPNVIRVESINNTFENAHFIIFWRNPYAHCESLIRRNKSTPKTAARHALKCLEYQRKNQESSLKSISFSYEELTTEPEKIESRLQKFIPELSGINSKKEFTAHNFKKKKMKMKNLNEEKIGKLSQAQLDEINEVFSERVGLLNFFGYELKRVSGKSNF